MMSWIEISTNATYEAIDWIRTMLSTIDYSGTFKVNNLEDTQLDTEHRLKIVLQIPNNVNARKQIELIDRSLSSLHRTGLITELKFETLEVELQNLDQETSAHKVGERFVILNSNDSYVPKTDSEIVLKIENSLAFGSGLHPATMLALTLLEKYVKPGMYTLDLGCGSGILSIAMAKLGAHVLAIDNDRTAVDATQMAVQQNQVADQVTVMVGSLGSGSDLGHWMGGELQQEVQSIQLESSFDLIAANILGRIHVELVHDYQTALRQSDTSILLTSGFTFDYENELNQTFAEAGFEQIDSDRIGDWVALVHRLKSCL